MSHKKELLRSLWAIRASTASPSPSYAICKQNRLEETKDVATAVAIFSLARLLSSLVGSGFLQQGHGSAEQLVKALMTTLKGTLSLQPLSFKPLKPFKEALNPSRNPV